MRNKGKISVVFGSLLLACSLGTTQAAQPDITKSPPKAPFQPVSKLVGLPDFLPGMGTLYVDPATLPAGPFLGYDHQNRLVDIIYMIPLKDLDEHKPFETLGQSVQGLKVDHTDITFNPGHAGVPDAHYHVTQWLISHDEQVKRMK